MANNQKYFPGFLESLMRKNGISQVELNKATGIAVSRINNYLKGKYRTVTPEHLEQICFSVTQDKLERSELLKVYLMDLLTDNLKPLVEINPLAEPKPVDHWLFQQDRLPKEFNELFKELYKMCAAVPRIRERTGMWTRVMMETTQARPVHQTYSSHIRRPVRDLRAPAPVPAPAPVG